MHILETVITNEGDIRIPDEVQRTLGVKPSDKVRFVMDGHIVRLEAAHSSLMAGFGAVQPRNRPEEFAAVRSEVETLIGESLIDDHSRT